VKFIYFILSSKNKNDVLLVAVGGRVFDRFFLQLLANSLLHSKGYADSFGTLRFSSGIVRPQEMQMKIFDWKERQAIQGYKLPEGSDKQSHHTQ
jgi:hypothetical protein